MKPPTAPIGVQMVKFQTEEGLIWVNTAHIVTIGVALGMAPNLIKSRMRLLDLQAYDVLGDPDAVVSTFSV